MAARPAVLRILDRGAQGEKPWLSAGVGTRLLRVLPHHRHRLIPVGHLPLAEFDMAVSSAAPPWQRDAKEHVVGDEMGEVVRSGLRVPLHALPVDARAFFAGSRSNQCERVR